ncbi:MAG: AAA family ATPase [Chloroflexi bacterium]|nr:AAA family ATPase [Chloroflexota bacterium]
MTGIETAQLVEALLRPQAYPHRPEKVELAQTQMSLVFMTGEFVYKVKKPVNLGYLDYTTLEKRLFFCQQEVALNRRLCPGIYLGVATVSLDNGKLVVEGKGEATEYAVKMRQLPAERMMDVLLVQGKVSAEMVKRVAARMARFHREAATNPAISAFGSLEAIQANTEENFSQTQKYVGSAISPEEFEAIKIWTRDAMAAQKSLFQRRVEQGRIRDCHGDLHAANVCFTNGVCIYDCIEFNDRFRYCDVASETAFLAMDLDFHGRPGLSRAFTNAYGELSKDGEIAQLLDFYKVYRACVRGKVECFRSDDKLVPAADRERALQRAQAYFRLAASYVAASGGTPLSSGGRELKRVPIHRDHPAPSPVEGEGTNATPQWDQRQRRAAAATRLRLFITVGLTGTGKTVLAEALTARLGLALISSDVVRKKLAAIPLAEHRYEEFDRGLYSAEFTRRTYDALFEEADRLLAKGKSVILDASFRKAEERRRAGQVARSRGADLWTIEVTCPEEVVRERLEQRMRQANVPSDGRWEVYVSQKQDFDPVETGPGHVRVDSSRSIPELVEQVVQALSPKKKASASKRSV